MPGESTLPNEHYPDYFQVVSVSFYHAMVNSSTNTLPIMYVEPRATNGTGIVIDSIVYGVSHNETSADTGEIIFASTPQSATGTSIQSSPVALDTVGEKTGLIDTSNNFVPAGNWLIFKSSAGLSQVHCNITIRFRSRLK